MTATLDETARVTDLRYEVRGGIKELFESKEQLVLASGPGGTGKTLCALWKMHLAALQVPKMKGLIVRQTLVSLTGTTLVTFNEQVVTEAIANGDVVWFGGSNNKPAGYRYRRTGSFITVGGLDKPSKFLGGEYDRVLVDEAVEVSVTAIETLLMRLRGTAACYKQIMLLCNPDSPTHWLQQRHRAGQLPLIETRHRDNPAYVNADGTYTPRGVDYFQKLDALTGVRRKRYRDGIWAAAEGVIYTEYDPQVHRIPTPEFHEDTKLCARGLPWNWTRIWSIDFGFNHPTVIQRWAEGPDGQLYLYAEQYQTQLTVEQHVENLNKQVYDAKTGAWLEPRPYVILADHDAEDRATFTRHFGMPTQAAKKDVRPGIEAVKARLAPVKGRPRIYLLEDALTQVDPLLLEAKRPTCTADEFGSYIWNEVKDAPVKENDDGMDALRYVVANRDLTGKTRMRFFR